MSGSPSGLVPCVTFLLQPLRVCPIQESTLMDRANQTDCPWGTHRAAFLSSLWLSSIEIYDICGCPACTQPQLQCTGKFWSIPINLAALAIARRCVSCCYTPRGPAVAGRPWPTGLPLALDQLQSSQQTIMNIEEWNRTSEAVPRALRVLCLELPLKSRPFPSSPCPLTSKLSLTALS